MMMEHKMNELIAVALARLKSGVPNSDEFVANRLNQARVERNTLLSKIRGDVNVLDLSAKLSSEIQSIDEALCTYQVSA